MAPATTRFEQAESDPEISKEEARPLITELRTELLKAQYARLDNPQRSLLIVVAGIDGAGKGATVNLINEWMDSRHIRTLAFGPPSQEEAQFPFLWRYWKHLPAKGRTGIVFGSWYAPLFRLLNEKPGKKADIEQLAQSIREFEALISRDGVQVLKLWYHLSRDAQKRRIAKLESDPDTAWMVQPQDHLVARNFKTMRAAADTMLELTDTPFAPWQVIPSADDRLRNITTGNAILSALRSRSPSPRKLNAPARSTPPRSVKRPLARVNYSVSLSENEYDDQLAHWRGRLARQVRSQAFQNQQLVLLFEGNDAAGKGGTIRRVTHALDARQYCAVPIAAPTDEERARPYLWRFWRALPARGHITIFDRSWYGRVLVERVEKFAKPLEWQRAYEEINQFEQQLAESNILLLKFWLAITKDVQLERFKARERSPFKPFKITEEDWRNRGKWAAYTRAANDMIDFTSTPHAPWHIVPSNDKRHARISVLETIVKALDERLA
ncbi:MAG TPA: polyphosphate:AMP phosphotransferase [Burkholderiaceae bacterium]|nr:polyphosphate:AMP phosphotransferase [Burkholderiaceae bacterium]